MDKLGQIQTNEYQNWLFPQIYGGYYGTIRPSSTNQAVKDSSQYHQL